VLSYTQFTAGESKKKLSPCRRTITLQASKAERKREEILGAWKEISRKIWSKSAESSTMKKKERKALYVRK